MSLPTAINEAPHRAGRHELALFFALVALVFVTRLPYLDAGYGVDADAWGSADTMMHFAQTGDYRVSRFPGFVYYEIPLALVAWGGAFATNSVSALMAGVAAGFVALIPREFGSRDYLLGALAFAFIPAVFLYSTWSEDYVWTMAFIIASFYGVLRRRYVVAGLCLGVAIGSRLTSGGMLIPFSLFIWLEERARICSLLIFNLSAGVLGAFAYMLIILKYGISAIKYVAYGYPTPLTVLNRLSVDVWGVLGILCLIVVLLLQFVHHKGKTNTPSIPASLSRNVLIVCGVTAGLGLIGFLYLPAKSAYLLPFVPFAFFWCARFLERKYFVAVCLTLLISPFVLGFDLSSVAGGRIYSNASLHLNLIGRELTLDFLHGQLTLDHLHRLDKIQVANRVLTFGESATRKTVIVQGEWQPQIQAHQPAPANPSTLYVYFLPLDQLKNYLAQGYDVYYLPGQRELNLDVFNFDLQKQGAQPYAGSDLD